MSSVTGGGFRGRGRGSAQSPAPRGRGTSSRGNGASIAAQRGGPSNRNAFSHTAQPSAYRAPRGSYRGNAQRPQPKPGALGVAKSNGSWQDRYQMLVKAREQERNDAIQQGLIADPDKPRSLSEAITPTGTCQEMCAEFERVQRVVQKDVWDEETDPKQSPYSITENAPDEARMVKKFRRAAAGLEEQLPSDLRPPLVLKRTCDYLFEEVIMNAPSLAQVHHFVWDRTRAIRNDFSIQQVNKLEDLRIAIECYERIARFHILSLHQLALPQKPYSKYDWQQEREQLDRTLLSLMQYYDDSHGRIDLPNEAEFRAYCVIFQLQDPTPDLEDRVQTWPSNIIQDPRVKTAVEVYMAACNVMDSQGPLKPRANHLIARQDWQRFWDVVESDRVSYLMGCVAEIYFNMVRRMVLNALFVTFRMKSTAATVDWTLDTLCQLLAFDHEDEAFTYCERFGFSFEEGEDGQAYLDLTSVKGRTLPEPAAGMPKQSKSNLVEHKRYGRTLPAVINGFTVQQAYEKGMIVEVDEESVPEHLGGGEERMSGVYGKAEDDNELEDDGESLFIPENKAPRGAFGQVSSRFGTTTTNGQPSPFSSAAGGFASSPFATKSNFDSSNPFQQKMQQPAATGNNTKPSLLNPAATPFPRAPTAESKPGMFTSTAKQSGQLSLTSPAISTGPKFGFQNDGSSKNTAAQSSPFAPFSNASDTAPTTSTAFAPKTSPFDQPSVLQNPFAPVQPASKTANETTQSVSSAPQSAMKSSTANQSIFANPSQSTQSTPLFSFMTPSQPATQQATTAAKNDNHSNSQPSNPPSFFNAPQVTGQVNPFSAPLDGGNESKGLPPTSGPTTEGLSLSSKQVNPFAPAAGPSDFVPPGHTRQPPDVRSAQFTSTQTPSNPVPPASSSSSTPISSNIAPSSKRTSFSTDTKPKKPSPLSNSVTATDDSTAAGNGEATVAQHPLATPPATHSPTTKSNEQTAAEEYEAFISELTHELLHNPLDGLLKQYVEFTVSKTITAAQQALITEQNNSFADEYRHYRLSEKYGHLWRQIFWQCRLAKTGRARRERRLRRLHNRQSHPLNSNSIYDPQLVLGSSTAASPSDTSIENFHAGDEMGQVFSTAHTTTPREYVVDDFDHPANTSPDSSQNNANSSGGPATRPLRNAAEMHKNRSSKTGSGLFGWFRRSPTTSEPKAKKTLLPGEASIDLTIAGWKAGKLEGRSEPNVQANAERAVASGSENPLEHSFANPFTRPYTGGHQQRRVITDRLLETEQAAKEAKDSIADRAAYMPFKRTDHHISGAPFEKDQTQSQYFLQKALGVHKAEALAAKPDSYRNSFRSSHTASSPGFMSFAKTGGDNIPVKANGYRGLRRSSGNLYGLNTLSSSRRSSSNRLTEISGDNQPRGTKRGSDDKHEAQTSPPAHRSLKEASGVPLTNEQRGTQRGTDDWHDLQTSPPSHRASFKATGVKHVDEVRGTKRRFDEEHAQETSPPTLRSARQAFSSPVAEGQEQVTATSSKYDRCTYDDIIANARAACASIRKDTEWYKKMNAQMAEEDRRASLAGKPISYVSPSTAQAMNEAQSRDSHIEYSRSTGSPMQNVPAYWLRDSKFVPRDQYYKAIETANANMAARAALEASHVESRIGENERGSYQTSRVEPHVNDSNQDILQPSRIESRLGDTGMSTHQASPLELHVDVNDRHGEQAGESGSSVEIIESSDSFLSPSVDGDERGNHQVAPIESRVDDYGHGIDQVGRNYNNGFDPSSRYEPSPVDYLDDSLQQASNNKAHLDARPFQYDYSTLFSNGYHGENTRPADPFADHYKYGTNHDGRAADQSSDAYDVRRAEARVDDHSVSSNHGLPTMSYSEASFSNHGLPTASYPQGYYGNAGYPPLPTTNEAKASVGDSNKSLNYSDYQESEASHEEYYDQDNGLAGYKENPAYQQSEDSDDETFPENNGLAGYGEQPDSDESDNGEGSGSDDEPFPEYNGLAGYGENPDYQQSEASDNDSASQAGEGLAGYAEYHEGDSAQGEYGRFAGYKEAPPYDAQDLSSFESGSEADSEHDHEEGYDNDDAHRIDGQVPAPSFTPLNAHAPHDSTGKSSRPSARGPSPESVHDPQANHSSDSDSDDACDPAARRQWARMTAEHKAGKHEPAQSQASTPLTGGNSKADAIEIDSD